MQSTNEITNNLGANLSQWRRKTTRRPIHGTVCMQTYFLRDTLRVHRGQPSRLIGQAHGERLYAADLLLPNTTSGVLQASCDWFSYCARLRKSQQSSSSACTHRLFMRLASIFKIIDQIRIPHDAQCWPPVIATHGMALHNLFAQLLSDRCVRANALMVHSVIF